MSAERKCIHHERNQQTQDEGVGHLHLCAYRSLLCRVSYTTNLSQKQQSFVSQAGHKLLWGLVILTGGVGLKVALEVSVLKKLPRASAALVGTVSRVTAHVQCQVVLNIKRHGTEAALVLPRTTVHTQVFLEDAAVAECLGAEMALERTFACVGEGVPQQV